jgi:hypothetical protein
MKGLSPHHDVRSDLQMIVRAYRALTYRGGIDADALAGFVRRWMI